MSETTAFGTAEEPKDTGPDVALTEEELYQDLEPASHLSEVSVSVKELVETARESPDFLSALAAPDITEYSWPPMYLAIWSILCRYATTPGLFKWFALGLPRGFIKTTFIKLYVVWCILYSRKKFILILSENLDKAQNIIADIMDMLSEPNMVRIFGSWKETATTDTQKLKKFTFRGRDIIIAGLGVGGSVRGLNIKNARPDLIVLDDVQSREAADSEVQSDGIWRWMNGTVMKAKSNRGVLVLFIANMYPTPHSILKKLQGNKFWEKLIAGAILVDAQGKLQSLWEELRPLATLLQEWEMDKESGLEDIFNAEVLNDPNASTNSNLDLTKIPPLPFEDSDQEIHQGSFVVIDPSNDKANSDKVAVGYFQVHDAKSVLWDMTEDRLSPMATVTTALRYATHYGCRAIFVESVAYQATLVFWFRHFIEQLGIEGLEVLEIYPGRASKNSRILTMFKQLTGGANGEPEIYLHPRVRARVLDQAKNFNRLKTDNRDNVLDLLTYAPRILSEFAHLIENNTIEMEQGAWTQDTFTDSLDELSIA